jgi:HK97 family phage major capsid protein
MNTIKLREERASLIQGMDAIVAAAQKEGRNLSTEESNQFDKMEAAQQELRSNIERLENLEGLRKEMAAKEERAERAASQATKPESRAAFAKYLRYGAGSLNNEERALIERRGTADQVEGTDSLGGFLVPEDFSNALSVAQKFTGTVERIARVITTSNTGKLQYPTVDDTSVIGALLAEAAAETVSDMTFGNVELDSYTYSSKIVKVSRQLMADSAFDLNAFLVDALGSRIARGTNAALTTGDGSSKPNGIVTASAAGKTTASATAITAAELLDLMYSVDAAYANSSKAGFMCHQNILAAIRKLGIASANDFPIFTPGMGIGENDMLFGKPIYVNNDMASSIATTNKTVLFGDFDQYVVRVNGGLEFLRLNERYADELVVGFIAYKRLDGDILQSAAIKHLVQA